MTMTMKLANCFLALCLAGCLDQPTIDESTDEQAVSSGLILDRVTAYDVNGRFADGDQVMTLVGHAGPTITAELIGPKTTISVSFDPSQGEIGTMTFDIVGPLDQADRNVLHDLAYALDRAFPYQRDPGQRSGALLRSYAGFLAEWTLGPTHNVTAPLPPRNGSGGDDDPKKHPPNEQVPPPCQQPDDDGVTVLPQCCNGGTVVAWQHDAYDHCFVTMNDVCGMSSATSGDPLATDCPGRCGLGCLSLPMYTQDCLDHDLCLMHHPGLGATDPTGSCGDELRDAVDDFVVVYLTGIGTIYTNSCAN